MVTFYFLCLYRSSGHIVAIIAQIKKTCSSLLLLWGKMTLTILLMLRYISYKYFVVYFSLYSSVILLSCLILYNVSFFSGKELSVDGKKQELKKDENNSTRVTNAERERDRNWSNYTLKANILREAHI